MVTMELNYCYSQSVSFRFRVLNKPQTSKQFKYTEPQAKKLKEIDDV